MADRSVLGTVLCPRRDTRRYGLNGENVDDIAEAMKKLGFNAYGYGCPSHLKSDMKVFGWKPVENADVAGQHDLELYERGVGDALNRWLIWNIVQDLIA